MLDPSKTKKVMPDSCDCGRMDLEPDSIKPFYTHQYIEAYFKERTPDLGWITAN
jgi:hypothetical protein